MNNRVYYYTGVGSRKTPEKILKVMSKLANFLEERGFVLRTGDADGADKAFRDGVDSHLKKNIYTAKDAKEKDFKIAERIHPAWHNCSLFAKKLHTRNLYQVKGDHLDKPSEFLICWTKNGEKVGGTRTAIVYAEDNNIPVFNLGLEDGIDQLLNFFVEEYKMKI